MRKRTSVFRALATALGFAMMSAPVFAQEIRDSLVVSEKLKPEIAFAIGAAFPQGNFTRNVNAGFDGYVRISYPLKSKNGLSLMWFGGATDFKAENQGGILDTAGALTPASQELDYRSAQAYVGLQWTGSWQALQLRPRVGIAGGAHWVETQSHVRVGGVLVDSLAQANSQTRPGLQFQLASDWVLRNNIALTFEFKINHVWKVAQFDVSDGNNTVSTIEKSVSYLSVLGGLVFPI